jgi:hypothetical protein
MCAVCYTDMATDMHIASRSLGLEPSPCEAYKGRTRCTRSSASKAYSNGGREPVRQLLIRAGNDVVVFEPKTKDAPKVVEYVALQADVMQDKEGVWEQLKQSLLDMLAARRMAKAPKKPRPKGPCASLADDPKDRARILRHAYDKITAVPERHRRHGRQSVVSGPAQNVEVAERVGVSTYAIWRFRCTYPWFGWPPDPSRRETGTL